MNSWKERFVYKIYIIGLDHVRFYFPLIFMVVLYGKIYHLLNLHGKFMQNILDSNENSRHQTVLNARLSDTRQNRNTKLVIVSFVIVAFFGVSNLPIHVWSVLSHLNVIPQEIVYRQSSWILSLYFFGICVINPIIYAFGDKTLLAGYKKALSKITAFCTTKKTRLSENRGIDVLSRVTTAN